MGMKEHLITLNQKEIQFHGNEGTLVHLPLFGIISISYSSIPDKRVLELPNSEYKLRDFFDPRLLNMVIEGKNGRDCGLHQMQVKLISCHFCGYGHMSKCHYPIDCEEANCYTKDPGTIEPSFETCPQCGESSTKYIDKCLKDIINEINKNESLKTLLSCCGHNRYSTTIIVKNIVNGNIFEYYSRIELPNRFLNGKQKKRYYKKDEEGYHYLPWVDDKFSGIDGMKSTRNTDEIMYCPICKQDRNIFSDYLRNNVFPSNDFAYWFSCLITHYRHNHIIYYDSCWMNPTYYGSKNPDYRYNTHEGFRKIVNNRAKRVLIRKIMKDQRLLPREKKMLLLGAFEMQFNDQETQELLKKKLGELKRYKVIYDGKER